MTIFTGNNLNNTLIANGAPILNGFTGGSLALLTDVFGDTIFGLGGNDSIYAGRGNDIIFGGNGQDIISGGLGADKMDGGAGIDLLVHFPLNTNYVWDMQTGVTNVAGETAVNFEYARMGAGNDIVRGTSGINSIVGGNGNDRIEGRAGNDNLQGQSGNDVIVGGIGLDFCDGGAGIDTYDMTGSILIPSGVFNLNMVTGFTNFVGERATNFENVIGDLRSNTIIGTTANNLINGGGGNDIIDGGLGFDTLDGGSGFDTLEVRWFNSTYNLNMATGVTNFVGETAKNFESIATGNGNDTILGTSGKNRMATNGGNDKVSGLAGEDQIFGGAGSDTLDGGADRDLIQGNDGNDVIIGGTGPDVLDGGAGVDVYSRTLEVTDYSFNFATGATGVVGETAVNFEGYVGGSGVDIVAGNALANTLWGAAGADVLMGATGNDNLNGGSGNDTLTGGTGQDRFYFQSVLNSTTNVDRITDFRSVDDDLRLENAVFTALTTTGALAAGRFHIGASAADFDDRIIYNQATGALFYDTNGVLFGGSVKFAQLNAGTLLTAADFFVV